MPLSRWGPDRAIAVAAYCEGVTGVLPPKLPATPGMVTPTATAPARPNAPAEISAPAEGGSGSTPHGTVVLCPFLSLTEPAGGFVALLTSTTPSYTATP